MPNVEAVIAKYNAEAATAEAATDPSSAPPAGGSVAASAVADVEAPGAGTPASPTATNDKPLDHDELKSKLDADRARTKAKLFKKQAKADAEAAAKTKADAEAELAKWKALGKDKKWLDAVKESGRDPREVFEEMRQEAIKANTPEARFEEMQRKHDAEMADLRAELKKRDDRDAERDKQQKDAEKKAAQAHHERLFQADFRRALGEKEFAPLLKEYEPEQLFGLANSLYEKPSLLHQWAKTLKVDLTAKDGTFTMKDIFAVMRAQQAAHHAKMQRLNQSAEPQTRDAPVTQEREANPTVNGTAERKAGTPTTIGNDLATLRASGKSDKELRASMTRDEWREFIRKRHENATI